MLDRLTEMVRAVVGPRDLVERQAIIRIFGIAENSLVRGDGALDGLGRSVVVEMEFPDAEPRLAHEARLVVHRGHTPT